eukprot:scaffold4510_cov183-Amphora_coffeaeformis.AAC.67
MTSCAPKHRIELFFNDKEDLRERVKFLKSHGFHAFNLVNKNQKDTVAEWVECIQDEFGPDETPHVCAHYSLKYNKVARKGAQEHNQRLCNFLRTTKAQEVLLISGSGKKTAWNTVQALCVASETSTTAQLAVAYNPYFPDRVEQAQEDQRLEQKLGTNTEVVKKVYLQFGTDLMRLQGVLEALEKKKDVAIAGSIFLPTPKLIAQQKFRPWNGVFLSPEFLSGPEHAQSILMEIMKLYRQHNVEMLWEAPGIRTEKDLKVMMDLIAKVESNNDDTTKDVTQEGRNATGGVSPVDDDSRTTASGNSDLMQPSSLPKRPKLETYRLGTAILLFGSHDLRLGDNQAVEDALKSHERVVPAYLWTPQGQWGVTGALEVVLQEALLSLESTLESFGLKLICWNCKDDGNADLLDMVKDTGAMAVYWNRQHTTESRLSERKRRKVLADAGVTVIESQSSLLYDPELIELDTGFHGGHRGNLMPFLKNCKRHFGEPRRPTPYHETVRLLQEVKGPDKWPSGTSIKNLSMARVNGKFQWDRPIRERFVMSEAAGRQILEHFFQKGLRLYESERSRADRELATSKLSPHLRLGTISPNELYWRTKDSGLPYDELKTFSRRLFWRDLAYFQLKCFPDMHNTPIRKHYQYMEWVTGDEEKRRFDAWKWGETGFPIIDAGMRERYATGWMTQSVRMVVASFLVEYLRVNWVKGCEWFHYTLVDADPAINSMILSRSQWGIYPQVGARVGQIADYSAAASSLGSPKEVLGRANVVLGETYPNRIVVDLKEERTKSTESTLEMRRRFQNVNTDRGYDLITLPGGKETVVFTKKEYRIDRAGQVLSESARPQKVPTRNAKRRKSGRKKT